MPDYDVEALSLAVPGITAPVAAYRPAVLVRNNGIYPANVTGTVRVYRREPPGDLLATFPIALAALGPGESGNAQASLYWTPTAADIGKEFLFAADITTPGDQVETNNHLSPATVLVTEGEPTPPLPVEAHATQHEAGGDDEVNLDGMHGVTADPQTPVAHKARHQLNGDDVIDVTNLNGVLAEPQHPEIHAGTHATGASDPVDVETLVNVTGLEHVANKGEANGYAELNNDGIVPSAQIQAGTVVPDPGDDENDLGLRFDRNMGYVLPKAHAAKHDRTGTDPLSGQIPVWAIIIWDSTNPTPDGWQLCPVFPAIPPPFITLSYLGLP